MRPETVEWLRQSDYDIGTAEAMYNIILAGTFILHLCASWQSKKLLRA
jgi:hypothetical protein